MGWIHILKSPLKVGIEDCTFSYGTVRTDRDQIDESNERFNAAILSDRIVTVAVAFAQYEGALARKNGRPVFQPAVLFDNSFDGNRTVYTLRVLLDFGRRIIPIPFGDIVASRDSQAEKDEHETDGNGARVQIERACIFASQLDNPVQIKAGVAPVSNPIP